MNDQDRERHTFPRLEERYERYKRAIQNLSDEALAERYSREMLKVKVLHQFGRQSRHFGGYPNTLTMNLCRRTLERRNLPIPSIVLQEQEEGDRVIPPNGMEERARDLCSSHRLMFRQK
jgi:hypothetical protein